MDDKKLQSLFRSLTGNNATNIEPLKQGGSGRRYYRLSDQDTSLIGCLNENVPENEAFFHLAETFRKQQLNVPEVLSIDKNRTAYLQTDLGDDLLYNHVINRPEKKLDTTLMNFYKKVLTSLVQFQTIDPQLLNQKKFYPLPLFNRKSITWDLNYFKYYFLNLHDIHYDEHKLHNDFDTLISFVLHNDMQWFMYRDFQSRNILIHNQQPWFIDFQGGRRGPLEYDVASLLYQAKAQLTEDDRKNLISYYLQQINQKQQIDEKNFNDYFYPLALIRILQVLGAYGFRGLYQRKSHFLSSIGLALKNLSSLMDGLVAIGHLPELQHSLYLLLEKTKDYLPDENPTFKLIINSFSYLNGGIPADFSGHGGGYAFDCRMLPNPGREEQYRSLTGMDEPVQQYLAQSNETNHYIDNAIGFIRSHIYQYKKRGFNYLNVSFGCTGGQHRSVYCAEKAARVIQKIFPEIQVEVNHTAQQKSYIC